jgi:hypothetical protein
MRAESIGPTLATPAPVVRTATAHSLHVWTRAPAEASKPGLVCTGG